MEKIGRGSLFAPPPQILNRVKESFFGPASARSYKIGVVGDNWLVGYENFSEMALKIFLIFCIKLGDFKGRKVTDSNF